MHVVSKWLRPPIFHIIIIMLLYTILFTRLRSNVSSHIPKISIMPFTMYLSCGCQCLISCPNCVVADNFVYCWVVNVFPITRCFNPVILIYMQAAHTNRYLKSFTYLVNLWVLAKTGCLLKWKRNMIYTKDKTF